MHSLPRSAFVLAALSATLAGCGSSAGVSTSSLLATGSAKAAQAEAPAPIDPANRAVQVAAVSARAQKCGFNFDPVKLRTNYFAAEAREGAQPDVMNKVERAYDYTQSAVSKSIAGTSDFCSDAKVKEVKADLTRHLAGDFSPPVDKTAKAGLLDMLGTTNTREVMNPDYYLDPSGGHKRTKQVPN